MKMTTLFGFLLASALVTGVFIYRMSAPLSRLSSTSLVVDEQGRMLSSVFDDIAARTPVTPIPHIRRSQQISCRPDRSGKSVMTSIGGLFSLPVVHGQGCEAEIDCYSHYQVIEIIECPPACYGFYKISYSDPEVADWADGEHYDGTEGCYPLCTPVCNKGHCINNNP